MKKTAFFTSLLAFALAPGIFAGEGAADGGRFGACEHPFRTKELNVRNIVFDMMKEAGVQWVRTDFIWSIISPARGSFDFELYDEIVDALAKRGIKVLAILESRYDQKTEDWGEYIKGTVSHFKGRIKYWEVVNEQDINKPYNSKGGAELYGKDLCFAYGIIKEADPGAAVVYGGLAHPHQIEYLKDTLKVAAGAYDIMNFHAYPEFITIPTELWQEKCLKNIREAMGENGGGKPIWLTETGTATPPYSEVAACVIKEALKKLDLAGREIYALTTPATSAVPLARALFPGAKKIRKVGYSKISKLEPGGVLVLDMGRHFPAKYFDGLLNFVALGGTVIYPGGGTPFYYDTEGVSNLGHDALHRLHAGITPYWMYREKENITMPQRVRVSESRWAEGVDGGKFPKLRYDMQNFACLNYDDTLLEDNDEFIPLVCADVKCAGNDGKPVEKKLNVAALYKYNSSLKGNLICVSTDDYKAPFPTENAQAALLARDFIYAFSQGVEKVFKYGFRSKGEIDLMQGYCGLMREDFGKKPSYDAYATLVRLLGDSAKPSYSEKDGICRADWVSPSGENVSAFWCLDIFEPKKTKLKILMEDKPFKVLGVTGRERKTGGGTEITLKPAISPQYIVGGRVLSVQPELQPKP